MKVSNNYIDVIAAAMLAANNYPLLKAQDTVVRLRAAGLLDADYVCSLGPGPLTVQLANAGYDRGMLTSMFAERLRSLLESVRDGNLDSIGDLIESGDEPRAFKVLTKIRGVGPVVARTAWLLLKSTSPEPAR